MAKIFPFRGWRYAAGKVRLADVLTQPYDKITPAMQERYYASSPFNLIFVEKGKSFPDDTPSRNVYTRAAEKLKEWIRARVLVQDAGPSIYVYAQDFTMPGADERKSDGAPANLISRRGFIALGRLEDYSGGVVFPHEKTLSQPKADRLELLRHTRAQTGQLFMMYEDRAGEIESLLDAAVRASSVSELHDEFGVHHRLWKVAVSAAIGQFAAAMAPRKIVIADGHHRYETALAYRDECRRQNPAPDRNAPYEKAMMTFVNYAAAGLVILPTHRVIRNLRDFSAAAFRQKLLRWFEELPLPSDPPPSNPRNDLAADPTRGRAAAQEKFHRSLRGRSGERVIGIYTGGSGFSLYRLRTDVLLEAILPDVPPAQRSLDVVLLHRLILRDCLGISAEAVVLESHIAYEREMEAAIAAVDRGEAQMVFLLNPVSVIQVAEMALAGEVLPQKSTDFYPKLLSGLAIYRLDE
jgi:uncharacterized protein (DUF1015 family)